jgi:hypothetical protein
LDNKKVFQKLIVGKQKFNVPIMNILNKINPRNWKRDFNINVNDYLQSRFNLNVLHPHEETPNAHVVSLFNESKVLRTCVYGRDDYKIIFSIIVFNELEQEAVNAGNIQKYIYTFYWCDMGSKKMPDEDKNWMYRVFQTVKKMKVYYDFDSVRKVFKEKILDFVTMSNYYYNIDKITKDIDKLTIVIKPNPNPNSKPKPKPKPKLKPNPKPKTKQETNPKQETKQEPKSTVVTEIDWGDIFFNVSDKQVVPKAIPKPEQEKQPEKQPENVDLLGLFS